ncbi:MAG: hypothetical protein ACE15B_16440 [Bryobacteraceae bacterium]
MSAPFGNRPDKIERYRQFWKREPVSRPLTGFSLAGWFPFADFRACRAWQETHVTPEMIEPGAFVEDHLRMLGEGEWMDDDIIRGACPGQVAIPWLPAALGCAVRILPGNLLGEERNLPWEEALAVRFDRAGAWFGKYTAFLAALVRASGGAFPVSHTPELGPTDLHAVLRGHTQSLLDLADSPEESAALLRQVGEIFCNFFEETWKRVPLYRGGYFDAQYSLWAPGPIVRMQEDATAAYSPAFYRKFAQPVDRMIAARFSHSFIHLHSTSMFLLDAFLEIEEIRCFEINQDASGPPVAAMIPHFRKVQRNGRPLVVRGAFTADELRGLLDALDPRGLFLNIMVTGAKETEALRPLLGM